MDVVLIANPAARRVETLVPLEQVVAGLREAGLRVAVCPTAAPSDGARLAREAVAAGCRRVIAAGGDGTLNEVVQGLAGSDTELAVLPLGTGNILAHSMGLSEYDLPRACRVAATGQARTIDLGRMGGRYFAAMAGAGLDAQIARNLDPWWKQQVGKLAFFGEFIRTMLTEEPAIYRIRCGGEEFVGPVWGVLICNTNEYTWRVRLSPDARADDGLLDALIIHRHGFLDLMDLASRLFLEGDTGRGQPTATVVRLAEMEIVADPPAPWQIEGDVRGQTPVRVEVVPRALRLVMPTDG